MAYFTKEQMDATMAPSSGTFDPNTGETNYANTGGSYPSATLQPDGRYYIPDEILGENMKGDGKFFGFDLMGDGNLMEGFKILAMPVMAWAGTAFADGTFGTWASETMKGWSDGISNFFGGLSNASGAVADPSWGVNALAETAGTVAETGVSSIIQNSTGMGINPADMLQAPTNFTPDLTGLAPTQQIGGAVFNGASTGAAATGRGLIDGVIELVKENKGLIASAFKGMGDRSTALEIADKKIAADQALLAAKTQEQIKLDAAKKAAIQSGSYFDAKTPLKPGSKVLLRPDGTPVYGTGGLIANSMNPG